MILALAKGHLGNFRLLSIVYGPVVLIAMIWPALGIIALLGFAALHLSMVVSPQLTRFELTLPVPARVTLQARLLAAGALLALQLLLWLMAMLVQRPEMWRVEWAFGVVPIVAMVLMITYLAPGTPQLWSQASLKVETWLRVLVLALVSAGVWYAASPLVFLLLHAVAAICLYFGLVRSIPAGLQLPTINSQRLQTAGQASDPKGMAAVPSVSRLATLLAFPERNMGTILPIFAGMSLGLGSGISATLSAFFWLILFPIAGREHHRWLVALPLSHRQRLWLRLGPPLMLMLAAFVVGSVARLIALPTLHEVNTYGQETKTPDEWYASPTRVSLAYWHRTAPDAQPVIRSPWGETVHADTITLFGITRFNPYTARKESSERFVDWQFERASSAVYGQRYTLAEFSALPAHERPRPAFRQARAQLYFVSFWVTGLLLLAWAAEWVRSHRQRREDVGVLLGSFLMLAGSAAFFATIFLDIRRDLDLVQFGLESFLLQVMRIAPASWPLTLVLAVLPVFAASRLLEWQFARSEFQLDELATVASTRESAA